MEEYIAFDSHKRYTWVDRQDHSTGKSRGHRLEHAPGAVRDYLNGCEPGNRRGRGSHRELVLDYRRDRASRPGAAVGASAKSEADDGADQQDRQAGCARAESFAAQRHAAHGVDSAGAAARSARTDAHAVGAGGAAHAAEESVFRRRWPSGERRRANAVTPTGSADAPSWRNIWSACRSRRVG